MSTAPRKLVVLISGSGSNLEALIKAQNTPALPNAQITLVLSNRKAAFGLTRASRAKPPIKTSYLALQPFLKSNPDKTRDDYDAEIAKIVLAESPDLVVLAGWMHILGDGFLRLLAAIPVINLHPALPGAFDGANAIERAFQAFQRGEIEHAGAMVHRVVKDVDRARLHTVEHEIIVLAAAKILGRVSDSVEAE
ncbi:phosphoribosylglycinamide formyltransferase [Infundibulicybe gibba]|nr:phosphoribosylglycinamide formyltransferase [Infundibulicybe gibba]